MVRFREALHVEVWGSGPVVVLVHGSVLWARRAWRHQRCLAARWRLVLPNRRGFGLSPATERADFEVDAEDLARLLPQGVHLVGHSYGALACLLAAARKRGSLRSLTVIEPPALAVARGVEPVDRFIGAIERHWSEAAGADPEEFLRGFLDLVGVRQPRSPLAPSLRRGAALLQIERLPVEAEIPLDLLARTPFPKLVVSGGHHPAFEAICDVLEDRLGAGRAVIVGEGHAVQETGRPFNERLHAFLQVAERGGFNVG